MPRNRGTGAGVGSYRKLGMKVMFEAALADQNNHQNNSGGRLSLSPAIDPATGQARHDQSDLLM